MKSKKYAKLLTSLVPVTLIKDSYRYADDVTVTYNGINFRIQRGRRVMVPKGVELILRASDRQKNAAQSFCEKLSDIFDQKNQRVLLGGSVKSGLPKE